MVNGTKIKEPSPDCTATYYDCIDGVAIKGSCQKNYLFSKDRQMCVPKAELKCPAFSPCSGKKKGFAPDPFSCDGYYACSSTGKGTHDYCTNDMSFYDESCWPNSQRCDINVCLIVPNLKYFGVDGDCFSWQMCKDEKLEEGSCGEGVVFDRDDGSCNHESTGNCRPSTNSDGTKEGDYCDYSDFKIVSNSCTSYYYCQNNQVLRDDCAQGKFFDGTSCVSRLNYLCDRGDNPCEGLSKSSYYDWSWVNDPKDCKKYYHCAGDKVTGDSLSCSTTSPYFNEERQICASEKPTYDACYVPNEQ